LTRKPSPASISLSGNIERTQRTPSIAAPTWKAAKPPKAINSPSVSKIAVEKSFASVIAGEPDVWIMLIPISRTAEVNRSSMRRAEK